MSPERRKAGVRARGGKAASLGRTPPANRQRSKPTAPSLEVVVPVFNEADGLGEFHSRLVKVLEGLPNPWRILYVDDGSTDGTLELLDSFRSRDRRVAWLRLSRNFGHQAALTAGLDAADADAVVTIDGDGEHPPELIGDMLRRMQEGYDVVLTERRSPGRVSFFKSASRSVFYRLLGAIADTRVTPGVADFRLVSRRALDALRRMGEYHRYLRGMVTWVGFRSVVIPYQPHARLAGSSKYSLGKMMRLAADAVFSFSLVPLYLGLLAGVVLFCLAGAEVAYVASKWLIGRGQDLAPGWSSLMFILLAVGSLLMVAVSTVGIYVGLIYQEVKRRPVYLVEASSRELGGSLEASGAQGP